MRGREWDSGLRCKGREGKRLGDDMIIMTYDRYIRWCDGVWGVGTCCAGHLITGRFGVGKRGIRWDIGMNLAYLGRIV